MYHIISADSATAILRGTPYTVASDHPRYADLVSALRAGDEDAAIAIVTASAEISAMLSAFGDVQVFGGHVTYKGHQMHNYLVDRIMDAVAQQHDITPLGLFLDNVMKNPSRRATEGLYAWCEKARMPLTRDGCIIAYKIVNTDFTDCYTGKFDNSPGKTVEVARNQVDEDPDRTCSYGLHFCSADYLPHYGPSNKKIVLVKVNPADVVAFPRDYNLAKARCCKYEVLEEVDPSIYDSNRIYHDAPTDTLSDDASLADRIAKLERCLGMTVATSAMLADRLARIEQQLDLDGYGDTIIDRVEAAEAEAGL